mgnify:CR=1 FL=1
MFILKFIAFIYFLLQLKSIESSNEINKYKNKLIVLLGCQLCESFSLSYSFAHFKSNANGGKLALNDDIDQKDIYGNDQDELLISSCKTYKVNKLFAYRFNRRIVLSNNTMLEMPGKF